MLKKLKFFIIFILSILSTSVNAEIFIFATVSDQIITNQDVKKEIEYLQILNPNLIQVDKERKIDIAKNSLINELIKKNEIQKKYDLDEDNIFVKEYLKDLFLKLGVKDELEFKNVLLQGENYTLDEIKKKLKIEILWNELIYSRYANQIKIDKKYITQKINNLEGQKIKEYLISEIIFEKKINENLDLLSNKIFNSIAEIGFNNTANIYSVSDSSKLGGKLGWISENNLSEVIFKKLKNIKEGEITDLIQIRNSYMILKIEKIRLKQVEIDKKKELEKMIKFETNKQLNQFSRIFFNKSKMNYLINEN